MNWFKNLNAMPRLMSAFSVGLIATLGISYLAISDLSRANDRIDSLYHVDLVGATHTNSIAIDVITIRSDSLNAVARFTDPVAVAASEKDELAGMADLYAHLHAANKLFVAEQGGAER